MNIEKMCIDARARLQHHINRSCGQHLRAMRESRACQMTHQQAALNEAIDSMTKRLKAQGVPDGLIGSVVSLAHTLATIYSKQEDVWQ